MRFGDSRVQALAGAPAVTLCAVTGITNRSLRALMTRLLGTPYGTTQASYDLDGASPAPGSPRRPQLSAALHTSNE
jgi:hypothetical protein